MKIRTMIPAIIALVMLVGGPFGFGSSCGSDPRGGLVCYCGCARGEDCTMISCSGCCGAHAAAAAESSSSEMIPEYFPMIIPVKIVYGDLEAIPLPETIYLDVPDKPPKNV